MSSDQLKEVLQEQKSCKQEQDPHVPMSSKPQKEPQKLMSSSQQPDAHGLKSSPQSHTQKNPMFFAPEKSSLKKRQEMWESGVWQEIGESSLKKRQEMLESSVWQEIGETKLSKEEKEKQKRKGNCSVWNATFQDASSLNRHLRSHAEEKLEVCSHCGMTFRSLIRHKCQTKSLQEAASRHYLSSTKELLNMLASSTTELLEMLAWEKISSNEAESRRLWEKKSSKEAESRHLAITMKLKTSKSSAKERQEMWESRRKELQEMSESGRKKLREMLEEAESRRLSRRKELQEMSEWEKKSLEEAESIQLAITKELETLEKSLEEAESRHLAITMKLKTSKSRRKELQEMSEPIAHMQMLNKSLKEAESRHLAFLERYSRKKDGGVSAISGLNDDEQPQSNSSFSSGEATDLQTEARLSILSPGPPHGRNSDQPTSLDSNVQAPKGKSSRRKKGGKVSATSVRNYDEQPQNKSSREMKNPSFSNEDTKTEPPIFSGSWQFSETFTPKGGQLQAEDSDVILTIPEKAVDDLIREEPRNGIAFVLASMDAVENEASGSRAQELFTSDATSQRHETAFVDSKASVGVTIHGAISTDVRAVHETLKLSATESICSPVVEYNAGENFMFKKPVCISLPHFLPDDVNENDVRVYQVNRKGNEEICSETLRLVSKLTLKKELEEIQVGAAVDAEREVGTFYLTEQNRIIIVTNHFTGYFCTHCQEQKEPPDLQFRLYTTDIEKNTGDVDLTLLIWDLRMRISDFCKPWAPDSKDQMTFASSTQLERLRNENVDDVRIGVWIHFLLTVWMHKTRPDGTPWLKPNRSFDLRVFCPCLCHTEPKRVEWSIQCRKDPIQLQRSECYVYVDVAYVRKDGLRSDLLEEQDKSTARAVLKIKECSCIHSTISSQAATPIETGELQGAIGNPQRSDSNSCADNLLHGPGSLPPSYHHTPSFRHQVQPTLSEAGFGQNSTVNVNIGKISSKNVDLASMLNPQGNGMENYFEQNMRSPTGIPQNGQVSDRTAADQNGEETAMKSLTSSALQGARPKKRKQKRNRKSHCTPPGQCPTQPMLLLNGNERNVSNREDINQATQVPMGNVGNAQQDISTSSTPVQNSESHSFALQCPVQCSAEVSGTHTNGDTVSESGNAMLEALGGLDLVEDSCILERQRSVVV